MTPALALEKHYRVKELAAMWGFSSDTIIKEARNEQGVIAVGEKKRRLSIPESAAVRIHERLENNRLQAAAPNGKPLRIIRLRDYRKPRHIIKLRAAQQ
jgi:hypothetical protein